MNAFPSPRVRHWKEKRRQGQLLFASACASENEARILLPMAPDLLVFHPAFPPVSMHGETGMLSSLAFTGNANEEASRGFAALLPLCAPCPVAMGVCGTDPFLLRETSFSEWRAAGLEGLANFPTVGLVDGFFRADLEAAKLGFAQETECLHQAAAKGFFMVGFACRPEDAAVLAQAGCDILIVHLGLGENAEPGPLAGNGHVHEYFDALRKKGQFNPLVLLHADNITSESDMAAWKDMASARFGFDGIFSAGGPARAGAMHALVSTALI